MIPDMEIYERIRLARRNAGLTQRELGERVRPRPVSAAAVTQWEQPPRSSKKSGWGEGISIGNVLEVARICNCPIAWLLTGSPEPEQTEDGGKKLRWREQGGRTVPIASVSRLVEAGAPLSDEPGPRVAVTFPCGPRTFAVPMDDRSNEPSIPRGAYLFIDPDRSPSPGSLVGAIVGGSRFVVGDLRYESLASGVVTIVRPRNEAFEAARSDLAAVQIVGAITERHLPD